MTEARKVSQASLAKGARAKGLERSGRSGRTSRAAGSEGKAPAGTRVRQAGTTPTKHSLPRTSPTQRALKPNAQSDEAWRHVLELIQDVRLLPVEGSHRMPVSKEQTLAFEGFVAALLGRFMEGFARTVDHIIQIKGAGAVADLGDPEMLADRMTAVLPQPHPFDEYGPFYRASDVASWLGESRQSIHKKVKGRSLLGAQDSAGGVCLPVWQFRDDGTVVPHLKQVVDLLAAGTNNPWTWIQWLAVPDEKTGTPAWMRLATEVPDQIDAVAGEARHDAARWAA